MKAGKKIRGITKEANKSLSVLLPLSPPPPSPPTTATISGVASSFSWLCSAAGGGRGNEQEEGENRGSAEREILASTEKDTEQRTGEGWLDTDKDGVSLAAARWKRRKSEDQRERKV